MKFNRKDYYAKIASAVSQKPDTQKPVHTRPAVKSTQSEAEVLKSCLSWLNSLSSYYPCKFDRLNNGAGYTANGGWARFGIKGAADIIGVLDGRHVEIECKAGRGGQLSIEQQERRRQVEKNGGIYLIVHSKAELQEQMEPHLKPLREASWDEFLKLADDDSCIAEGGSDKDGVSKVLE